MSYEIHEQLAQICRRHPDLKQLMLVRIDPEGCVSASSSYRANHNPYELCIEAAVTLWRAEQAMPELFVGAFEPELRVVTQSDRCFCVVRHEYDKSAYIVGAYIVGAYIKGAPVVKSLKRMLVRIFRRMGVRALANPSSQPVFGNPQ